MTVCIGLFFFCEYGLLREEFPELRQSILASSVAFLGLKTNRFNFFVVKIVLAAKFVGKSGLSFQAWDFFFVRETLLQVAINEPKIQKFRAAKNNVEKAQLGVNLLAR